MSSGEIKSPAHKKSIIQIGLFGGRSINWLKGTKKIMAFAHINLIKGFRDRSSEVIFVYCQSKSETNEAKTILVYDFQKF